MRGPWRRGTAVQALCPCRAGGCGDAGISSKRMRRKAWASLALFYAFPGGFCSGGPVFVHIFPDTVVSGVSGEIEVYPFSLYGVVQTLAAADFGVDLGIRKNEPIRLRIVGEASHFLGFAETDGPVHIQLAAFAAGGLEFFELTESVFDSAVQALLVDAEVQQGFGVFAEGLGGIAG